MGNCVDFSILMHEYFKFYQIEHTLGFVAFVDKVIGQQLVGHAFPVFMIEKFYYIWNYFSHEENGADINGPFTHLQDIYRDAAPYYSVLYNSIYKYGQPAARDYSITILNKDELHLLDRVIGKFTKNHNSCIQMDIWWQIPRLKEMLTNAQLYATNIRSGAIFLPENISNYFTISFPSTSGIKEFFTQIRKKAGGKFL